MFATSDERRVAALLVTHARTSRRIRFEISTLLGNPALAREIEATAGARPGIVRASANPRSGRLLIEYAPDAEVLADLARYARPIKHRTAAMSQRAPTCWHALPTDAVLASLEAYADTGLSSEEAARRLGAIGANVFEDEAPPSRLAMFASQLTNLPTVLLLGSTVVSILLGDLIEAAAIVTVVGLNAAIGYHVERRSADLLAAWRAAELGHSQVIRDGSIGEVPSAELVPGDVLVMRAGTIVPADARVIDAHGLAANEAPLTGESEPVDKTTQPAEVAAALAERRSMLYRGTTIASGHGRAVIIATGRGTEIAAVQRLAAESRAPESGLQRRLARLSSRLAWSGIAATGAAAVASMAWRRNPLEIVREAIALGVAAIPEGMPVSTTAALVRAMAHMRERGIIVRRLATAETLGGVTVACSDKTGTLTENRMRVDVVSLGTAMQRLDARTIVGNPLGPLGALLLIGVLNSDVEYHQNGHGLEIAGSSTECALVDLARRAGIDPVAVRACWPRTRLVERRDGISYVISEHAGDLELVKGAPEQVIPLCGLSTEHCAALLAENTALAHEGLRVLAIGWRGTGGPWQYLGLVGLRDPLREGAAEAVQLAARAGIRTVMLTGDQRATAEAIAQQARLDGEVIDGSELPAVLADPARLRRVAAIARVAPADKVAVVEALRRAGEVVAMIGDGVNDAPALRAADVGVAVGTGSSDLARQTADVVLEREDLRSILEAVAEGRAVQDNLRRSIRFQIAGNLGEVLLAVGSSVIGRRPLSSLAMLWINMLTDTLPGLALAVEPTEAGLLDRPPARPGAPILDAGDWRRVSRNGVLLAGASALASIVAGPLGAFGMIGTAQFGYAAMCRPLDMQLPRRFIALVGGSAVVHLAAVASAPVRMLLGVQGRVPIAFATSLLGLAVPLYAAWATRANVITRCNEQPLSKESP